MNQSYFADYSLSAETGKIVFVGVIRLGWHVGDLSCTDVGSMRHRCSFICDHEDKEGEPSADLCATDADVRRCTCDGNRKAEKNKFDHDRQTSLFRCSPTIKLCIQRALKNK
jgi:hypothetical protein